MVMAHHAMSVKAVHQRRYVSVMMLSAALFVTFALGLCAGCTTTIVGPGNVVDPVQVYLVDYGRHPSLVLPRTDFTHVEYTYGEWQWYAEDHTAGLSALRALMVPTQGALGRRQFDAQQGEEWWEELGYLQVYAITVERDQAAALLAHLDERWEAGAGDRLYNARYDLEFVPDAQPYHLANNSNPMVAGWLEQLDCEVRGSALVSNWRIIQP